MARPPYPIETIRLRLPRLTDAFDRFDPAPLGQRRLAHEVMDYILHRAEEFEPDSPLQIVVHLDEEPADKEQASILTEAVQSCFRLQSDWERDERHEVFRTGRQYMVIGMVVFAFGAVAMWILQNTAENTAIYTFARDSSVILAWVVIWRPAEIFFYDWLPIRKRRQLFDRIAMATVTVEPPLRG